MRRDWCIISCAVTLLVGAVYAVACSGSTSRSITFAGPVAIGAAYVLSTLACNVRVFLRSPISESLQRRPILGGLRYAVLGGFAYGVCISLGVALAFIYVHGWSWDYRFLVVSQIALLTTGFVCSFLAAPFGLVMGVMYSIARSIRDNRREHDESV